MGSLLHTTLELSSNESNFILEALKKEKIRLDGRQLEENRKLKIEYPTKNYGDSFVQLGETKVFAVVNGKICTPRKERPNEGILRFDIDFSPMASPNYIGTRKMSPAAVELTRIVERSILLTGCVDVEALCILSGKKVWSLTCVAHVIDDCGNLGDCASIAILSALLHYRRNYIEVSGEDIKVFDLSEKEPVPLAIHHIPVCITFAYFNANYIDHGDDHDDGGRGGGSRSGVEGAGRIIFVIDPCLEEEILMDGKVTIITNKLQEICGIQKGGGTAINPNVIHGLTELAMEHGGHFIRQIEKSISKDLKKREKPGRDCMVICDVPDSHNIKSSFEMGKVIMSKEQMEQMNNDGDENENTIMNGGSGKSMVGEEEKKIDPMEWLMSDKYKIEEEKEIGMGEMGDSDWNDSIQTKKSHLVKIKEKSESKSEELGSGLGLEGAIKDKRKRNISKKQI